LQVRETLVFHFETINPRLPLGSGIQGLEDLCQTCGGDAAARIPHLELHAAPTSH